MSTSPIDNFVAGGGTSGATAQTNSRYYNIGTTTFTRPDGSIVRYLNRRIISQQDQYTPIKQYVVKQGDRIDTVGQRADRRPAALLDSVRRQCRIGSRMH